MDKPIESIARKEVLALHPYVCARDIYKEAEVFLDANENAYGKGGLNRYPDSDQSALRKAIAAYVGNGVTWRNVIAGNGSDELIDLAIRVFAGPGDNILCAYPDYSMYKVCAAVNGVEAREFKLGKGFRLDADAALAAADARTKMIFLSSPNNPSGTLQPAQEIARLARKAEAVVFVDEAYSEFAGKSAAGLVKKLPNLIVSRTFSKAWGLAGIRLGYLIAPEKIIGLVRKIKPPYNVSRVSGEIALAALAGGRAAMRATAGKLLADRKKLEARLSGMGFEVFPSSANFLLCRCPEWVGASALQKALAKRGVILRDFSSRPGLENCLRITVGKPAENARLLAELRRELGPGFDAVFFDIDDTLVDVSRSYLEAIRLTAKKISGKKVPISLVRRVKARPGANNDWDATVKVLAKMGVRATRKEVVPIFQRIYLGEGGGGDGLIAKEKALLDARLLGMIRAKVGLVTGRPRGEALIAMKLLGLPKGMLLVAMEDAKRGKPAPDSLLVAKRLAGARRPVYVGDSAADRLAAKRAGFSFVAIGKGRKQKGEYARFAGVNAAIRRLFA